LGKSQPSLFELVPFLEDERDKRAEILNGKGGSSDSALALVYVTLSGKHSTSNEAGDHAARLPWFLKDSGIFENIGNR
jgi:hypothetical protein